MILGQMFGMMLANVYRNGMLDGTIRDLRLAWNDVTERLRRKKKRKKVVKARIAFTTFALRGCYCSTAWE